MGLEAAGRFVEELTEPELACCICVAKFRPTSRVVLTDCGHHFHPPCLRQYLRYGGPVWLEGFSLTISCQVSRGGAGSREGLPPA